MSAFIWAALGGAIGAAGRFAVGQQALRLMGPNFPWGTLTVNVIGSLLMGLLTGALAQKFNLSYEMRVFLTTGILGGFTTFSAFSLDVAVLAERKAYLLAGGYVAVSVLVSVAALFAGLWIARVVLT